MTADTKRVYIFGGCGNEGRFIDLWAYDTVDEEWTEFPSPGESCKPRSDPGLAALLGNFLFIYGFSGMELDDMHYLDPNEGKWTQVENGGDKPTALSVYSNFGLGKYIVIYGGEIDPSDLGHLGAGQFAKEVYALDTETLIRKQWEDEFDSDEHPGPRGWCAYASGKRDGQEELLLVGDSEYNDRLEDIFFFKPGFDAHGK